MAVTSSSPPGGYKPFQELLKILGDISNSPVEMTEKSKKLMEELNSLLLDAISMLTKEDLLVFV